MFRRRRAYARRRKTAAAAAAAARTGRDGEAIAMIGGGSSARDGAGNLARTSHSHVVAVAVVAHANTLPTSCSIRWPPPQQNPSVRPKL